MSRASTEMEAMRRKMFQAVERMTPEDARAMLLEALRTAGTYEMNMMASATSFKDFDTMDFELDLTA